MRIALGIVNRHMATEGFVQAIDTERYRERRLQAQYIAWSHRPGAHLVSAFLETPQSEGMYFAGPESDFRSNVNEQTGRSGEQVLATYETRHGGFPASPYWAHAYDATTILLSAIESVAVEEGDRLFIDRAALREKVGETAMNGLIGTISCDEFGDCGTGGMNIYHHTDTDITDVSRLPVVYVYNP